MTKQAFPLILALFLATPVLSHAQDGPVVPGELEILRPTDKNYLGPKQIQFTISSLDRKACELGAQAKTSRLVFMRHGSGAIPDERVVQSALKGSFVLLIEGELAGGRDGLSMLLNHYGIETKGLTETLNGLDDAVPLALTRTLEFHDQLSAIPGPQPRATSLLIGREPGEMLAVRPRSHALPMSFPMPDPYNSKELKSVYLQTQEIERRLVWEAVRNPFLRSRLITIAHRNSLDPEMRVLAVELASEAEAGVAHTISPKKLENDLNVPLNVLPFRMQRLLERLVVEELNEALKLLSTDMISGPSIKHFEFDPGAYRTVDGGYDHELMTLQSAKGFHASVILKHWREFAAANNIRAKLCDATKLGKDLVVWVAPELVPGIVHFLESGTVSDIPTPIVSQTYSASSK